ncbi:hypothetical protein HMPREF1871_01134 [Gemelliphila asaccharolytica]|uniref:Uncharacterized protein n=1 Tax=Gemelliphila asaccharolytica TaxID=502393 RepID=A0ABR5TNS9_9BACL|nr:hypothetical protein HMPREF1871_01134 [Gemella asaccharolytica]
MSIIVYNRIIKKGTNVKFFGYISNVFFFSQDPLKTRYYKHYSFFFFLF